MQTPSAGATPRLAFDAIFSYRPFPTAEGAFLAADDREKQLEFHLSEETAISVALSRRN